MKNTIMGRFEKLEGVSSERVGSKIPKSPLEAELFPKVELLTYDIKRIKEIAAFEGKDPDNLSELDVWGIVSDALIKTVIDCRMRKPYEQ